LEYVAPLALFVFFAGVLLLRERQRTPVRGELGGPTADQRQVVRHLLAVLLVAWAIGVVAIVGPDELLPLGAAAVVLLVLCGVAVAADYRGVRAALRRVLT
jgi:peptidoglycan/LPS O-acetylase OafA/YrhL